MRRPVTVAVDVLGGDGAPRAVLDAVRLVQADPQARVLLVGPVDQLPELMAQHRIRPGAVDLMNATECVAMDAHPLQAVRQDAQLEQPRLTVTVAARAVRDGAAEAWVSVGHTGAAVAAAVLAAGRIPNMARPALAVVLPALEQPVVLLDAGAGLDASPQVLAQFAVAGWCYARALGVAEPNVGLLTIGSEPGKGDDVRQEAEQVLAERLRGHGIGFVGPVEGGDVVTGRRAQVVVTDGFTGNVLLKGIEGAVAWSVERISQAYADPEPARRVLREVATGDFAGGMLLGVDATTVIGHGAGSPAQIAACIRLAASAAERGLIPELRARLALTSESS